MKQLITTAFLVCSVMLGTACATNSKANNPESNKTKVSENNTKTSKKETDKPTEIEFFHGTMAEAMAKAKKEGKRIFFDAYAVWCGPCRTMASRTFTKQEVADYFNKNFVNVKMDMERGEGPSWSNKFRITAYPTLLILDENGEEVARTLGYQNGEQLISFGEKNVK